MQDPLFTVQTLFDYGATLAWALSGALIAARRGYDVIGLTFVALVSATGGGLLRDGLFLQNGPPALARTPAYLLIVVATVLLVRVIGGWLNERRHLQVVIDIIDALAIGAYACVGMRLAIDASLSLPAVALVGVVNAIGGSLLRDLLMRQEPEIFKPGTLMAVAVLASTLLYLFLEQGLGMSPLLAGVPTILMAALIRAASVRYDVRTRAMPGFDGTKKGRGTKSNADQADRADQADLSN